MHQPRNIVLCLVALCAAGLGRDGFERDCLAPVVDAAPASVEDIPCRTDDVREHSTPPRMTPVTAPPSLNAPAPGWKGDKADNICGIDDLKKVSNPAQVDYPDLMAATPQMQRIEKDNIDPDSPQGKLLRQEAVRLITKSCEVVRRRKGYCGIWKEIAHEDERQVPDATGDVKAEMN